MYNVYYNINYNVPMYVLIIMQITVYKTCNKYKCIGIIYYITFNFFLV